MTSKTLRRSCYVMNRCLYSDGMHSSKLLPSCFSITRRESSRSIASPQIFKEPCRFLSNSSHSCQREVLLPGKIFQSHLPDVDIPSNIPFHQLLFRACEEHKDRPALTDVLTGRCYTYNQLKENSIRVASALSRKGYKKGDVILMFSTNQIDYTVLMLAASCLGLWFSAANPAFTAEELARQIVHSGSKAVFTTEALTATVDMALKSEELSSSIKDRIVFGDCPGWEPFQNLLDDDGKGLPDVAIDPKADVFVLPYSSGTTGLPKGVMLTHHNILANVLQIDNSLPVVPDDNLLGLLPLYHIYGMVFVQFGALYKGANLHILPKFEPVSFMNCMKNSKITKAHLVPPLVLFMVKHPDVMKEDVVNLKNVLCGAAPLGKEITDEFLKKFDHGIYLRQVYGLTETSPGTNLDTGFNLGSIGNLLSNTQGKIVDLDTGENLGPNMEGELCVRGPQVMKGYYKNPEATKEMINEDFWLHTGDIGYYTEEGLVYICDRLKELIKFKGSQVAPAELEALLIGHPLVLDACVVGVSEERSGEVPKAFVVRKPDSEVSEDDIIKYIEERVAPTKRLRGGVEFIDSVPRNPSGKILRKLMRSR